MPPTGLFDGIYHNDLPGRAALQSEDLRRVLLHRVKAHAAFRPRRQDVNFRLQLGILPQELCCAVIDRSQPDGAQQAHQQQQCGRCHAYSPKQQFINVFQMQIPFESSME